LRRICGREYTVAELTEVLRAQSRFFKGGGGVTFSGGEPLYQSEFLTAMLDSLRREGIHTAIQTSGYTSEKIFSEVLARCDFVLFDIKHPDNEAHIRYTGVPNIPILKNLELLKASGVPFIGRTPLIEGVNSSLGDITAIAELVSDAENMLRYELLPYNEAAGGKYAMAGRVYEYDEYTRPTEIHTSPFTERGIEVRVL
jgi:pyruvate formate lyase activating enzyme